MSASRSKASTLVKVLSKSITKYLLVFMDQKVSRKCKEKGVEFIYSRLGLWIEFADKFKAVFLDQISSFSK